MHPRTRAMADLAPDFPRRHATAGDVLNYRRKRAMVSAAQLARQDQHWTVHDVLRLECQASIAGPEMARYLKALEKAQAANRAN